MKKIRMGLPVVVAGIMMAGGASHAAMPPGAEPKEWPANADRHQVTIVRNAKTAAEKQLIATAEAALPAKAEIARAFTEDPENQGTPLPADKNLWWCGEKTGVKLPYAITSDAVAYYKGLVEGWQKAKFTRYIEPSSKLSYTATVKFVDQFKQGDKVFEKVNVVTMELEFGADFTAETTTALHFNKTRQVVLDAGGKVLAVFGDGKTEAPLLAI